MNKCGFIHRLECYAATERYVVEVYVLMWKSVHKKLLRKVKQQSHVNSVDPYFYERLNIYIIHKKFPQNVNTNFQVMNLFLFFLLMYFSDFAVLTMIFTYLKVNRLYLKDSHQKRKVLKVDKVTDAS